MRPCGLLALLVHFRFCRCPSGTYAWRPLTFSVQLGTRKMKEPPKSSPSHGYGEADPLDPWHAKIEGAANGFLPKRIERVYLALPWFAASLTACLVTRAFYLGFFILVFSCLRLLKGGHTPGLQRVASTLPSNFCPDPFRSLVFSLRAWFGCTSLRSSAPGSPCALLVRANATFYF